MTAVTGIKTAKWTKITDENETNTAKVTDDQCLQTEICNGSIPGTPPIPTSCPVGSKKLRLLYSGTNIVIPAGFVTIYQYTGSGVLHGFNLDFNSDNVRIKLTIDGTEPIFSLRLRDIFNLQCDPSGDDGPPIAGMVARCSGNILHCRFPCPIGYDSSVLIQAQKTSGSNKTLDEQIVVLTQET